MPLIGDPFVGIVCGGRGSDGGGVINHFALIAECLLLTPIIIGTIIGAKIGAIVIVAVQKLIRRTIGRSDGPDRGGGPEIFGRELHVLGDADLAALHLHAIDACLAPLAQLVERHAVRSGRHAGNGGGAVLIDLSPILIAAGGFLHIDVRIGEDDGVVGRVGAPARGIGGGDLQAAARGTGHIAAGDQFGIGVVERVIGRYGVDGILIDLRGTFAIRRHHAKRIGSEQFGRIHTLCRGIRISGKSRLAAIDAVMIGQKFQIQNTRIGLRQLLLGGTAGERFIGGDHLGDRIGASDHGLGLKELGVGGVIIFGEEIGSVVAGETAAGQIVGDVLDRAAGLGGDRSEIRGGAGKGL